MNTRIFRMTLTSLAIAGLAGSLLTGCGAGAVSPATTAHASPAQLVSPPAAAVSTPAPTTAPTAAVTPSPTAVTDQELMDELAAACTAYAPARIAALYAPDAVFHDNVANETTNGLEGIQAKAKEYAGLGFRVANTSAPIRQDNVVAAFQDFGVGADTTPGLGVVELKDGKVQTMWEYPAGTSHAASSPASSASGASADEALMADINAIWGGTADAAKVAAVYAPGASFHDTIEGKTYTGLEAIQAKVASNAAAGYTCLQGSASIRQGNVVAVFHRFDLGGAEFPVLAVFELEDGKVINQWAYAAP